jgi:hypothetical protein
MAGAVLSHFRRPRIWCETPVFDFGSRPEGSVVEHEFVVRNLGARRLEIRDAKSSCGCTVVDLGTTVVEPHGSVPVGVRLSLAGRKGKQVQRIVLLSDDPLNPHFLLSLEGESE